MPRLERVHRAVAIYDGRAPVSRRFLSKRHRDAWAEQRLEGYPEEPGVGPNDDGRPPLEPALRVELADSDPISWPDEDDEQRVVIRPAEVTALDTLIATWLELNPTARTRAELARLRARLKFLDRAEVEVSG